MINILITILINSLEIYCSYFNKLRKGSEINTDKLPLIENTKKTINN